MIDASERQYLGQARVGRLATADAAGRPHVVPICFALLDDALVTPIDEKPKDQPVTALRRSQDIRENPYAAVVVDEYTEEWSNLGWVQVRGQATHVEAGSIRHESAVTALRDKYDQYRDHTLETRPIIDIDIGSVLSWGTIDHQ